MLQYYSPFPKNCKGKGKQHIWFFERIPQVLPKPCKVGQAQQQQTTAQCSQEQKKPLASPPNAPQANSTVLYLRATMDHNIFTHSQDSRKWLLGHYIWHPFFKGFSPC